MIRKFVDIFGSERAAWMCAALVLGLLAWLSTMRTPIAKVWGDEGTFLAMTASLALDGDLRFGDADLARLDVSDPGRASLILERTERGIFYSKPIVLPLIASPLWALFGDSGLVVLNALALLFALLLTDRYLARLGLGNGTAKKGNGAAGESVRPLWVVATFTLAGVVVPYIFWRMADLLQLAFCLTGLVLCFAQVRNPGPHSPSDIRPGLRDRILDHRLSPWIGVVLIAVTMNMRLSNGALILIPVLAELFRGRWKTAVAKGVVGAVTVGAVACLTFGLTGAWEPYRAERTTFMKSTGYPAGSDGAKALERFEARPATHHHFVSETPQILYASGYFWVGKHTGLLFYFPAAVLFLIGALRRPDRLTWACLIGAGVVLVYFWAWKPVNYFGGATFIGNRYFLSIYPAFLMAMSRLPSRRGLAVTWVLAAVVYGSASWSVVRHHELDPTSQSHARAGLMEILPYESTSRNLDGTVDRYWTGQFIRFLDPAIRVTKDTFELQAGRPFANVMVAQWQEPGLLRYLVEADADEAFLIVKDWRNKERRYAVGRSLSPGGRVGIELETSKSWRHHGFWFGEGRLYESKILSFRLEAPDGTKARFHHLGDPELASLVFAYERLEMEIPTTAVAGTSDVILLKARNTSRANWHPQDVTAVTGRYRLYREGEMMFESGRIDLPSKVGPGELLELPFTVVWPDSPGPIRLEADLVLEHVDWFQARVGDPVLEQDVMVLP